MSRNMFSAWGRLPLRPIAGCLVLFLCLSLFLLQHNPSSAKVALSDCPATTETTEATTVKTETETIPNNVHFAYILSDPEGNFTFHFSHFLSIYAAWYYWRPDTIYLHTNVQADGATVTRARDGELGKWSRYIFTLFDNLEINTVEAPTHTNTGMEIKGLEHRSDFVRVKAVHELGGIYIDFDVHPLRDIDFLRKSGFKAIAGRQLGGQINSGTFMSVKGGKMVKRWMDGMHDAYTGGWTTHSNEVITKFGQRLIREPGEMLIMEREAFAPGSWENADTDWLFATHNDTRSNLANYSEGDILHPFDESFDERWNNPEGFPEWAHDWSSSYLLHAFSAARWGHEIEGFKEITPKYVLERRSNFARAVYPVAHHLYQEGLISVGDSHLGL